MMMSAEQRAYITLLMDALTKKKDLLQQILIQTQEQGRLLGSSKMDPERFEELLQKKEEEIRSLSEIDAGFDTIFKRVEQSLIRYKEECKAEILKMQALITEITEYSASVQALEKKNSMAFKLYISSEKSNIREKKVSSQMASSYYKNMSVSGGNVESYFFDKKK